MRTLIVKELRDFFKSYTAYFIVISFLLTNSVFLWLVDGNLNILSNNFASLSNFFFLSPFLLLLFIPAMVMGAFATEYSNKTINLLLLKPISSIKIVFAKFFSYSILSFLLILPTTFYLFSVIYLSENTSSVDIAGNIGSYIGLICLSQFFIALSLFVSSYTSKQIISFIISVMLNLSFFFLFEYIHDKFNYEHFYFLKKLSLNYHYQSLSRGIIYISDLLYLFTFTILFLLFTAKKIQNYVSDK